jgi:two-component system cell cycle response regulator DivK
MRCKTYCDERRPTMLDERQRVLLVEDNEQNLELAQFLLEEAGLTVEAARNAFEARQAMTREEPALVLMDIDLPGIDGLDLVSEIRRKPQWRRLPVVALTAHAMRGDRERFLAGGCNGYISKPIQVSSFVADVRRYLGVVEDKDDGG